MKNATITQNDNPSLLLLRHKDKQLITLTYTVHGLNQPLNFKNHLLPIFEKDHLQFSGGYVFIYPKLLAKEKNITINLNWHIPKHWQIANSFGAERLHEHIIVGNIDKFTAGFFLAGKYQLHQVTIKDGTVVAA